MPGKPRGPEKTLEQIVEELGLYPIDAFEFVREGLNFTVQRIHGRKKDPEASRHVSGQQLCEGLRQYALLRWGMLARTVLARWGITRTEDFGRIVFAMIEGQFLAKTDEDSVDDFRNVYDFESAFDAGYRIKVKA